MDNEYHYTGIDVKVKMIYDGKDNDIISQYVTFTKVYDKQVKLYGRTREAVCQYNQYLYRQGCS